MQAYQETLPEIEKLGGQLIAISPQLPDNSLSAQEKWELGFAVVSDQGNRVARDYGLVFRVPESVAWVYENHFKLNLPEYNGDESWELPIPGIFVVSQSAQVEYAFVDPDYTQRAEPDELVDALRRLN